MLIAINMKQKNTNNKEIINPLGKRYFKPNIGIPVKSIIPKTGRITLCEKALKDNSINFPTKTKRTKNMITFAIIAITNTI